MAVAREVSKERKIKEITKQAILSGLTYTDIYLVVETLRKMEHHVTKQFAEAHSGRSLESGELERIICRIRHTHTQQILAELE